MESLALARVSLVAIRSVENPDSAFFAVQRVSAASNVLINVVAQAIGAANTGFTIETVSAGFRGVIKDGGIAKFAIRGTDFDYVHMSCHNFPVNMRGGSSRFATAPSKSAVIAKAFARHDMRRLALHL